MPRSRLLITKEWIEKRIQNGYGSGSGAEYQPWLVVQDFSSLGRCHRIKGWKHGRVHYLFSDLERNIFLHHQFPRSVTDIKEQFPLLPLEETVEIAREIGVRHPTDPRTKHPIVMTTDLHLTVQEVLGVTYHPVTIKYLKDLQKMRALEKLEIERRYWAASPRNHILKIFTEQQVNPSFIRNMLWLHPYFWLNDLYPLDQREVNNISSVLTQLMLYENLPLQIVAQRCDRLLRLEKRTGLAVVRHLLANRLWEMDMNIPIRTEQKLILLSTTNSGLYNERLIS